MPKPLYGYHAIEEAIKKGTGKESLYISGKGGRISALQELAEKRGCPVVFSNKDALDKLAAGADHRGAVLLLSPKAGPESRLTFNDHLASLSKKQGPLLVLILDGVTDPHNFGALLRSADQFAVDLVLYPERRSAGDNATVRKVSAGASVHVPKIAVPNIVRSIEALKKEGFWIYGAEMNGKSCWELSLPERAALILGAEGKGISRLVKEHCDELISIPSRGHIDSLNVSVAGGILLYECRRQQWA
jgi:23S rRNA (guanosine2251-2'-O)-methyltransferase